MLIYSIIRKDTGSIVYIGSTCTTLSDRKAAHKQTYINRPSPIHILMIENGGWDSYEFKILSEHSEITKQELLRLEKFQINLHKPLGNSHKNPILTENERLEYKRKYHQDNRDKALERAKQPYVCPCGITVRIGEKTRHFKSNNHKKYIESVE